nr:magnetosome protein MamA-greigite [Desulfobacteraceae bacterium]
MSDTKRESNIPVSVYIQWPLIKVGRGIKNMVNGYKKLFHVEPDDLKAIYLKKARAADLRGDTPKCVRFMETLTSKYPNDADLLYQLGIAYEKNCQYTTASEAYQKVTTLQPSFTKAHYRIGILSIRERNFENAVRSLTEAIHLEPESAEINFRLGQVHDRLKDYEKAIVYFTKAVTLNPKFIQSFKHMALTYDSMDNHKKALECLKRVLELEETT